MRRSKTGADREGQSDAAKPREPEKFRREMCRGPSVQWVDIPPTHPYGKSLADVEGGWVTPSPPTPPAMLGAIDNFNIININVDYSNIINYKCRFSNPTFIYTNK